MRRHGKRDVRLGQPRGHFGIGIAIVAAMSLAAPPFAVAASETSARTAAHTTKKTDKAKKTDKKSEKKAGTSEHAARHSSSKHSTGKHSAENHPAPKPGAHEAKAAPIPRPRPRVVFRSPAQPVALMGPTAVSAHAEAVPAPALALQEPVTPRAAFAPRAPLVAAPTATTSEADAAAVKRAIALARNGKDGAATEIERQLADPLARKLVEWAILRSDDNTADFARYNAFILANPSWPGIEFLRRRAEAMLWQEHADPRTVRAFFAQTKPLTAKGRFALARALLAQGDRTAAQYYVRQAWREDGFSRELENQAREMFRDLLSAADDKARMDDRFYSEDTAAAMRVAERLGGTALAIAKARAAVIAKSSHAKALLDAVPPEARHDAGYLFSRIQWLRRNDRIAEAGQLMLAAPRDPAQLHNLDQWWIERRLLARKLLDIGDARTAYLVARDAAPPKRENYRIEHEFTAGWIALRFLNDPATAAVHFARINQMTTNPISLSRAGYWQGRAAEAAGRMQEARAHYQRAARYTTAYYGQLAGARLGLGEIALPPAPALTPERRASLMRLEVVRAAELLYASDQRDLVIPFAVDLADKSGDVGALSMLAEIAGKYGDARAMLLIGKTALGRGLPLGHYAFPTIGVPHYTAIGPNVEPAVVYSIVRQESEFNRRTVSSAKALGLMQVTPEAGRYVARKFNAKFDQKRLLQDMVYNVQIGSAELGDAIQDYRGSYILAFAAYNAGRGRVKEWVARYGDPRDSRVDPIDWVERIPFSETRNYVQRVMENLQVYRARFGGGTRLMIGADIRRGALAD